MHKKIFGATFVFAIIMLMLPTRFTEAAVFLYNFDKDGTLPEAGSMSESWSPYWWVNSGAYMKMANGRGLTILGSLPSNDKFRTLYAKNNPVDTDNGYHPQNIFRLVTRKKWVNARQEAYFDVRANNLSSSSNRNQSNGLLFFNRYQDGQNLYYVGVRVDGTAVIKKKKNGSYYTLAQPKGIYPGTYDRTSLPNLLPKNKWIGLRSEVINKANGAVELRLYKDDGWQGKWTLIASAIDDGVKYGGSAFTQEGYAGIRTDFMDVEFENFRVTDIDQFSF